MPRTARKVSSTSLYHVINRGMGKQIIFEDNRDRGFFMHKLSSMLAEYRASLLAWCLMDNHFHLLLEIPHTELSAFMHRLQTSYAGHFNTSHDHTGTLFGTRFKSEPVESDEYLMGLVRYIHENPLKAHLPGGLDQPWSSYREYIGKPRYADTSFVLDVFGSKEQFVSFHQMEHADDTYLDIEATRAASFSDEQALQIAGEVLGKGGALNLKGLPRAQRNAGITLLRESGLGVRQIQRLTGIPLATISYVGHRAAASRKVEH